MKLKTFVTEGTPSETVSKLKALILFPEACEIIDDYYEGMALLKKVNLSLGMRGDEPGESVEAAIDKYKPKLERLTQRLTVAQEKLEAALKEDE